MPPRLPIPGNAPTRWSNENTQSGQDVTETIASNQVAVVTGGARGIGLAVGQWFLAHGYAVALLDIDGATLAETAATIGQPDRLLAIPCDVSKPIDVAAAAAAVIARWGRVDALVNNAGVAVFKPALETSFEEWRHVLGTNLDGAFLCTQAFGQVMSTQRSGAIVNIASISGLRASTLRVAYGTSKAAIIHLTKQYAVELGNYGVRVNAVCPGPVETEMAKLVHSVAIRSDYYDTVPLGRYGTPEEMAKLVGFLCSNDASYLNGQYIANDGGFDAAGVGLPTFRRNAGLNTIGNAP
jgi:NAD(P)-dependent dehydrogenase (short-subunit alcohol dehydrogenase family)